MSTEADADDSPMLSQDAAFSILGDETRMELLKTLGAADGPLAFSELRKELGIRDSGQFNYHLDKLTGHFVARTEQGYELTQSGRRVVMAVLSGTVTNSPRVEATEVDFPCTLCQAPMEVTYHEEHVRLFCTECDGHYGDDPRGVGSMDPVESGYLGSLPIPPAAVRGRTAGELYMAAATWGNAHQLVMGSGVCPDCGSTVDRSVAVCEDHDAEGSLCDHCGWRHPTRIHLDCTHCISEWTGRFDNGLLSTAELQRFLLGHGLNLVAPTTNIWALVEYEEEVLGTEPFEARYTFTIEGESLTLTVDDDLQVVDASEPSGSA